MCDMHQSTFFVVFLCSSCVPTMLPSVVFLCSYCASVFLLWSFCDPTVILLWSHYAIFCVSFVILLCSGFLLWPCCVPTLVLLCFYCASVALICSYCASVVILYCFCVPSVILLCFCGPSVFLLWSNCAFVFLLGSFIGVEYSNTSLVYWMNEAVNKLHRNMIPNPQEEYTIFSCSCLPWFIKTYV